MMSVLGPRAAELSDREVDMMDWGFAFGVAWAVAREQDPAAPEELVSLRALDATQAVYDAYRGTPPRRRPTAAAQRRSRTRTRRERPTPGTSALQHEPARRGGSTQASAARDGLAPTAATAGECRSARRSPGDRTHASPSAAAAQHDSHLPAPGTETLPTSTTRPPGRTKRRSDRSVTDAARPLPQPACRGSWPCEPEALADRRGNRADARHRQLADPGGPDGRAAERTGSPARSLKSAFAGSTYCGSTCRLLWSA